MNSIIITGRLGRDPELKTAQNGTEYTNFAVAVDRRPEKDGTKKTDWFNCTAFGKMAAFVTTYFKKGDGIVVEGALESDTYEAKDGTKRTKWSIRVEEVEFPQGGKKQGGAAQPDLNQFGDVDPKDIPF